MFKLRVLEKKIDTRTIGEMVWPIRRESKLMLALPAMYSYYVCPVQNNCQIVLPKKEEMVSPIILRVFSLASEHCCCNPVPEYYFHTRQIKQKHV